MEEINIEIVDKETIGLEVETTVKETTPPLENLYVLPSNELQEFESQNYYGYDKVTVEGIMLQDKEVTPTKKEQIIIADDNYSGLKQVTVSGDNDLVPENIKEGKEIFGVEGTAQTLGYEYEEFDPINVIDLLDNDTVEAPYGKILVLLMNRGTNSYQIKYSHNLYYTGDVIKFSDGGELTVSGTQTYTFDENKDFINSLGQKVRYMIIYKNVERTGSNTPSFFDDILLYYFKNRDLSENGGTYLTSNSIARAIVFDENTSLTVNSSNLATYSSYIEKYEMPVNSTISGKSLSYAFNGAYNFEKAKLNLNNEVNNLSYCFGGNYNTKEIELNNCPDEVINCNSMLQNCYTLRKFVAKPILKPANYSTLFNYIYRLKFLSGIDFINFTSNLTINNGFSLEQIENIANININFNISSAKQLTHQSLLNIFNALVDLTGQDAKTLTIGTINLAKVTDEEKAIAINKNWTLA